MHQSTIEKLHALRLGVMADALTAQLQQPAIDAMPFAERRAMLERFHADWKYPSWRK